MSYINFLEEPTLRRPVLILAFAGWNDASELAVRRSRYEGPTGIVGVISAALAESEIPVGSLWGNVPHYISASPNPKVVHALLSRLNTIFSLGIELSDMERAGRRFERQVNE